MIDGALNVQTGAPTTEIRQDKFVMSLMQKLPGDSANSFSDEQLLALKVALGGRSWGVHAVDLRWTLSFWHRHYYFVFLAGRNRRVVTRREREVQSLALAVMLSVFVVVSGLVGILVLYLIKSALGIDLIPGFSFGVWDWFREAFLG